MNLASAIVIAVVAAGAAAAVFGIHRRRRAGKSIHCGECALKGLCIKQK